MHLEVFLTFKKADPSWFIIKCSFHVASPRAQVVTYSMAVYNLPFLLGFNPKCLPQAPVLRSGRGRYLGNW
jgi:hypothetical protein